jgi:DNA-binding MarR family transcriptional regulator
MAAQRLSTLQKAVLRWLAAEDQRLRGVVAAAHQDLVQTLEAIGFNKGNVSTSLKGLERKGLERKGLVTIARTPGGKAEAVDLMAEGRQRAARLTASCE